MTGALPLLPAACRKRSADQPPRPLGRRRDRRRHPHAQAEARAAWWLFAAGQFLYFSGDLYTYGYRKVFGADVPFPSIGDAFYLAVYPVLLAGLFVLVKRRNPRRDRSALIDALILTIGVGSCPGSS